MRYASAVRFALLLLAACSQAPTLTIGVATNPLAFAFRPDGGDWQQATELSRSELQAIYEIPDASGTIAVACTQPNGSVQVEELYATEPDLANELYGPILPWPQLDCTPPTTSDRHVELSGSMLQGGYVYVDDDVINGTGEWQFNAGVTAGVHDIVATNSVVMVILHDETVETALVMPTIDLSNGLDLGSIEIGEADGEPCSATTELTTVHGTRVVTNNDVSFGGASFAPSEALEPGDVQLVHLVDPQLDPSIATQAYVVPNMELGSVVIDQPEAPVGATFGSDDVSVDFSQVAFTSEPTELRVKYATPTVTLAATSTAAWTYQHAPYTRIELDESFPGFNWPIVPIDSQRELVAATRGDTLDMQQAVFDPPLQAEYCADDF